MKPAAAALLIVTVLAAAIATTALMLFWTAAPALAAEAPALLDPSVARWAFASAAAAVAVSATAAGYAVAQVGSAAIGALAEKPELFGRVLIVVGLAEGIAIYGLIVAVLIFNRIG